MATFHHLPAEIHDMIFAYLPVCDKVVITSKQMRKGPRDRKQNPASRVTSRLTLAFSTAILRKRYRKFLERYIATTATVVRVNVVDYGFHNFSQFLADAVKPKSNHADFAGGLGYATNCFNRFHFKVGGTNPIDEQDRDGPYFAANLIFTRNFDSEDTRLRKWLTKADQMGKKSGHMRVYYKVTKADESPALNEMLSRQSFGLADDQGQLKFIKEALRYKFAFPVDDGSDPAMLATLQADDINRGIIKDLYTGVDGEAQDGDASVADGTPDAAAPPPLGGLPALGGLPMFPLLPPQPAPAPFGGLPYMPPNLIGFGQPLPAQPTMGQPVPAVGGGADDAMASDEGSDGVRIKEEPDDEDEETRVPGTASQPPPQLQSQPFLHAAVAQHGDGAGTGDPDAGEDVEMADDGF